MSARRIIFVLIVALWVAGCESLELPALDAPPSPPVPTKVPPPTPDAKTLPDRVPATPSLSVGLGEAPPGLAQMAIDDLTSRLNADASKIEVISAAAVVWNDGSLGCPEPGVEYIQVLIEGYQIVLEYKGQTYDYRSDGRYVRLCELQPSIDPDVQRSAVPQLTAVPLTTIAPIDPGEEGGNVKPTAEVPLGLQPLVDQAVADLANRLSIQPASIEVVRAESVVWPDSSLGCPQPGMEYLQVLTEGARIELRVKDLVYTYHSGGRRGLFLCENPAK